MKLTYLGTAAAEGFPAVFCNCEHCREASAQMFFEFFVAKSAFVCYTIKK